MRSQFAIALSILLVAAHAAGQQSAAPIVYYAAPGVTAPELLPSNPTIASDRKCRPLDGAVKLSGVVDADGRLRDIETLASGYADLAKLALSLVSADRFKPGTHEGVPAAVAITIEVGLQTCMKGGHGVEASQLTLRAHPMQAIAVRSEPVAAQALSAPKSTSGSNKAGGNVSAPVPLIQPEVRSELKAAQATPAGSSTAGIYKIGGNISAPVPLLQPEAKFSSYAKKNLITGVCLLGLIVDANGMPQNIHIIKSLEPSLDKNAIKAVKKYRFRPAMKDGTVPVPVEVRIEVNFRLY